MTKLLSWIGLVSSLIIIFFIPYNLLLEPKQQESLLDDHNANAIISSTDHFAENCVICHGAGGEGIGDMPALNTEAIRTMTDKDLEKVISRGRNDTIMAAWAVDEGGIFSNAQIEDMVVFLKNTNWEYVAYQVEELGLTPPEIIELEVTDAMIAEINKLPDSEGLLEALTIFGENCAACHGGNGAGTVIAPAIDSVELRERPQEEIVEIVSFGVPGTIMTNWDIKFEPEQINSIVNLIYRWPEIVEAGIEFPEVEMSTLPATPEMIEAGARLFNIACKTCHGVEAFGSPMAPALNNQLFLNQTPDAAIYQIIAGGVSQTMMPAWGSRLNNEDLLSLVAYLRNFESTAPSIIPPILD